MRVGISSIGISARRRGLDTCTCLLAALRAACGERLQPAHAGSDAAVVRLPIRRFAGTLLTCVPPHSSIDQPSCCPSLRHRHHAHLVAVFLAEKCARARGRASSSASAAWWTGAFCSTMSLDVLDALQLGGGHRLGCEKSKRSRSAPPASLLRHVMPSTWRNALVQQMGGEWFCRIPALRS